MAAELVETRQDRPARAILVGLNTRMKPEDYARSMRELEALAEALNLVVVWQLVQNAETVTHATYIGSGKVRELKEEIEIGDADLVIFNEALSPLQTRNLEKELDTEVIDRTGLILQIFSRRARTREARLQVESAHLKYMLPRLVGMGHKLSRQGGGSGRLSNKGAGEQQLELDRRRIEHRIAQLRRELEGVDRERTTQKNRRSRSGLPRIALAGYTNAGKSTLMNALLSMSERNGTDSSARHVFEKDMLFATLDTSVRRIQVTGHPAFLLADTVGFVSQLPHDLVQAFRSTLEEVCEADLILEVIDSSDPDHEMHRQVTDDTLRDIGAGDIPRLYLYNKADLVEPSGEPFPAQIPFCPPGSTDTLYLAAGKGIGLEELLQLVDTTLASGRVRCTFLFPYDRGALMQRLRETASVESEEYLPEGCRVQVLCSREQASRYREWNEGTVPRSTPS